MKQLAPALSAAILALTVTHAALADDDAPAAKSSSVYADPGTSEVRRPPSSARIKLIIGGLAVTGLGYAASIATASLWSDLTTPGGFRISTALRIPFIGPWVAVGKTACAANGANCNPVISQLPSVQSPTQMTKLEQLQASGTICKADDSACRAKAYILGGAYVLDGLLQIAGLGLIAEGIAMKTEPTQPQQKPSLAGKVTVRPMPVVSAHFTGVGIVGSF